MSALSPWTKRTPRLTCASEGNPFRRLLITSKAIVVEVARLGTSPIRTSISAFWRLSTESAEVELRRCGRGKRIRTSDLAGPGRAPWTWLGYPPIGTLARTRTSMIPVNGRLPTHSATRVWFPRHGLEPAISWMWTRRRRGPQAGGGFRLGQPPSELLQRAGPDPGIEPGRDGSADRRLLTWPGRVDLTPGEGLEPPSRASEPRVLPLDDPGVAPPTGIEPATFCSTGRRPLQGTTRA